MGDLRVIEYRAYTFRSCVISSEKRRCNEPCAEEL